MHFLKSIWVQLVLLHHSPPQHALERLLTSAISARRTTAATTNLWTRVSNIRSLLQPWFNVYVFAQLLFSCRMEVKQSCLSLWQQRQVDCPEEPRHRLWQGERARQGHEAKPLQWTPKNHHPASQGVWAQGLGSDDPGSSVCRYYARYNIHSAWQADKRSKSATGITHYMLEIDLRTDIVLWITSQILKYIFYLQEEER